MCLFLRGEASGFFPILTKSFQHTFNYLTCFSLSLSPFRDPNRLQLAFFLLDTVFRMYHIISYRLNLIPLITDHESPFFCLENFPKAEIQILDLFNPPPLIPSKIRNPAIEVVSSHLTS